ncbi:MULTISPECIES: TetR/AcrR family transcriptional regulator [Streptomyces]|uniref:TetR/AcrR family transcriptional regulator n=1 Tax=Streptomyces TaxID=1883 RepID=UPI000A82D030|nr:MULTISPECIES: TetR/AcrR family transcriptional regulator [Streptomyces]RPK81089.1 HTH-type transcriptional regulator BetI [Streptomyces sp. ADI98-10]
MTLVAHAVHLLDEAGAEAVTVREVARRAGVSPGAPFRHFPDRAALLTAVAEAVAVDFGATQTEAVASATSVPFRAPGTAFVRYALTHPHRLALLRGARFGADRTPALEEWYRAFTQGVTDLIIAGQQRGERRQADPELIGIAAQALAYGLSQMFVDNYLDASRADALINQVVDLFGLGVLAPGSELRLQRPDGDGVSSPERRSPAASRPTSGSA